MVSRDIFFPAYLVDKFLEKIPPFPNALSVKLSNGFIGVVIGQNKENLSRPIIRIISDYNDNSVETFDINLMKELSVMIEKVLN